MRILAQTLKNQRIITTSFIMAGFFMVALSNSGNIWPFLALQASTLTDSTHSQSPQTNAADQNGNTNGDQSKNRATKPTHARSDANKARESDDKAKSTTRPTNMARTFTLMPISVRGDETANALVISSKIKLITIKLGLKSNSEYKTYQARILTADNDEVWKKADLAPISTKGRKYISLRLPSKILSSGSYFLSLESVADNGELNDLVNYSFSVKK